MMWTLHCKGIYKGENSNNKDQKWIKKESRMSKWRSCGSKEIGESNDQIKTNDNTLGSSKSCLFAKGLIKSENENNDLNTMCLTFKVFRYSGSDFKVRYFPLCQIFASCYLHFSLFACL